MFNYFNDQILVNDDVSSNLIGSLSLANKQLLFTSYWVNNPFKQKKKQNGWLKFHCNSVSESEILWIQEKAVTENKKKAMEFDLKVFKG